MYAWGSNSEGQLGTGDYDDRDDGPCEAALPEKELARAVACAGASTFVLTVSGCALSCGCDDEHQLGWPDPAAESARSRQPVDVSDGPGAAGAEDVDEVVEVQPQLRQQHQLHNLRPTTSPKYAWFAWSDHAHT